MTNRDGNASANLLVQAAAQPQDELAAGAPGQPESIPPAWEYRALRPGENSIQRTAGYVIRTSGGVGGRGREASSYPD